MNDWILCHFVSKKLIFVSKKWCWQQYPFLCQKSREIWETASFCKQSLHYARGSVSLSFATIPHSSCFPKSWWYTLMLIRKNYYFIGTQIKDIVGDKIRTRVQGLELKLFLDSQSRFYSYFWVLEVWVVSMKTGCRSSHSTLNSR